MGVGFRVFRVFRVLGLGFRVRFRGSGFGFALALQPNPETEKNCETSGRKGPLTRGLL